MNCDTITRPCELQLVCARCATVVCGGRGAAGYYNRHGDGHDHFADRTGHRVTWHPERGLVNIMSLGTQTTGLVNSTPQRSNTP